MATEFELAEAYTQLTVRGRSQFDRVMGGVHTSLKSVQARMNAVAVHAKRMLLVMTGGIGVMLKLSADQEKAEAKLEAVLEATGHAAGLSAEELKKYASQLQAVTTYGDEATIAAMGMLASFKNIKGDQFKETIKAAQDMSTVMDQDLKSSIVMLGKALNDPAIGLTAMTRAGVTFSKEQQDVIKNLAKTNRLAEAQTMILKELRSEFGGAAEKEAKTFGGRMVQLKNAIGDLGEQIGGAFVPDVQRAADALRGMTEETGEFSASTKETIRTWGWFTATMAGFGAVAPTVLQTLSALILAVTALGVSGGPAGMAVVAIGALTLALSGLAAVFVTSRIKGETFLETLGKMADGLLGLDRGMDATVERTERLKKALESVTDLKDATELGDVQKFDAEVKKLEALRDEARKREDAAREALPGRPEQVLPRNRREYDAAMAERRALDQAVAHASEQRLNALINAVRARAQEMLDEGPAKLEAARRAQQVKKSALYMQGAREAHGPLSPQEWAERQRVKPAAPILPIPGLPTKEDQEEAARLREAHEGRMARIFERPKAIARTETIGASGLAGRFQQIISSHEQRLRQQELDLQKEANQYLKEHSELLTDIRDRPGRVTYQ